MHCEPRSVLPLLLVLTIVLPMCTPQGDPSTGTHIGNPPSRVRATAMSSLSLNEGASDIVLEDDALTRFTLTEAVLYVDEIELALPKGIICPDITDELQGLAVCQASGARPEDEIEIEGPFLIDLIKGTSAPTLAGVRIPSIAYERIAYRLLDRSFVAKATFEYNGQDIVLELFVTFNENVPFGKGEVGALTKDTLSLELDAAQWFNGFDVRRCIERGELTIEDGRVVVDNIQVCDNISATLKANIKRSANVMIR